MWDTYGIEQQIRLKQAEDWRRAAHGRLVREAQLFASARRGPGLYRRALHRAGGLLVSWGSRLQARMERPELERLDGLPALPSRPGFDRQPGGEGFECPLPVSAGWR